MNGHFVGTKPPKHPNYTQFGRGSISAQKSRKNTDPKNLVTAVTDRKVDTKDGRRSDRVTLILLGDHNSVDPPTQPWRERVPILHKLEAFPRGNLGIRRH